MKALLIEDDKVICALISNSFRKEGIEVTSFQDGQSGLNHALSEYSKYDVIILDIVLPSVSGIEICKKLRELNIEIPIIILSAKNELDSKVECLNIGADDYVTKPFELKELLARIYAATRRTLGTRDSKAIKIRNVEVLPESLEARVDGKVINLTKTEFKLLHLLMRNSGKLVQRDKILAEIWGTVSNDIFSNAIDVHIKDLRRKIKSNQKNKLIITVRGSGYKFVTN